MINVSNDYKNELKQPKTIDANILIGSDTLTSNNINMIKRMFKTGLFKTVMKQVDIDSNIEIEKEETLNPQFGLLIGDNFEYISLGNYKAINEPELNKDTNSYKISAYDKIVESMVPYALTTSDITYPCSVRDLFVAIFTKLGWSTSGIPNTFTNSTSIIEEDVYSNVNFTYRDVLDELCTISCMFLVEKNNIPTLLQKTLTNEVIDEYNMKDANIVIKERVFFNSLVFSRAEDSDNIYRKDDESIAVNGLHEFKISNLQILSLNWRDNFIESMWNYIKTFEYYTFDVNTYGITYLEPIDQFTLSIFNNPYTTLLLNSELTIGGGASEKIYADKPKETETEYKYADETDRRINQTYLIVDKQNQKINAVVSQVDTLEGDLAHPTNQLTGKAIDIDDATNQPLLDFSMEGELEQDSTTGKQLFDYYSYPTSTTADGITITNNGDGTITLNGTSTSNSLAFALGKSANIQNYCAESPVTHTAYYVSGTCTKVSTSTTRTVIRLNYNQSRSMIHLEQLSANNNEISATEPQNTATSGWGWQIVIGEGDIFDNFKIRYGVELGSTSTDWEEYTGAQPSPNPDFPKDIHSVIGDNTIEITGKNLSQSQMLSLGVENLFNINAIIENKYYDENLNFTDVSTYNTSDFITTSSKQLTVSATSTQENPYVRYVLVEFDSSGTALVRQVSTTTTALKYTFTIQNANTTQVRLCYRNDAGLDNIQLKKGNKANSYSEYGVKPIELCKIGNYQDYIYETKGKWYKHKEINKIVLNGSESDWGSTNTASDGTKVHQYLGITDYLRIEENICYSNFFTSDINNGYGAMTYGKVYFRYSTADTNYRLYFGNDLSKTDFLTWLSTHPVEVYYVLQEEQEEEITNEELIDQLNSLMNIPLFKGINHITIDTFNLQPTINVEYKRDIDINNNFSNRKDLDNYYTKIETNAQIQVASGSIMTEVSEVREAVSENSNSITTLTQTSSTLQTQTELLIDFKNNIDENGVDKVKTETNYTFNKDGLSIAKSGSNISSKIDNNALEIKEGNTAILFAGYNTTTQKTEVTSKEMIAEKITAGNHRCEIYNFENEDKTAWFYVG